MKNTSKKLYLGQDNIKKVIKLTLKLSGLMYMLYASFMLVHIPLPCLFLCGCIWQHRKHSHLSLYKHFTVLYTPDWKTHFFEINVYYLRFFNYKEVSMAGYFLVWSSAVFGQPKVEIKSAQKLYELLNFLFFLLHLITFFAECSLLSIWLSQSVHIAHTYTILCNIFQLLILLSVNLDKRIMSG